MVLLTRLLAELVLYLLLCGGCRRPFAICESCFRGQRHCGRCRGEKRLESRRAANGRHQASFDGRVDHARRQAEYRARLASQVVTDHGSPERVSLSTVLPSPASVGAAVLRIAPRFDEKGWLVCAICGRPGPLIDSPAGGKGDRRRGRRKDPASALRGALAGGNDRER